ncbi:DUF4139 domain-containing protein [bacterium]|nr:DUF4139 domain-containing protein [bacterium]
MKVLFVMLAVMMGFSIVAQADVAVTIYNDDLALVKDVRNTPLKGGTETIEFTDVASRIDPTSVYFKSLTAPNDVTILEQNYEYDLVNTTKLLHKYVDQPITVITKDGAYPGTLLAADGSIILREKDGRIRMLNDSAILNVEFPELPDGLITRPTLVWQVNSRKSGKHQTELSYLTSGMEWHAEYVAVTTPDGKSLELSGWVSIENNSGATYPDAAIKLVAGEVHRAATPRFAKHNMMMTEDMAMAAAPQFEEKSFFEYHMYTLQRPATVKDRQIKQISLFPAKSTDAKKIFIYNGQKEADKVRVEVEFINSAKAGLGMPLPAGKIRLFQQDPDDKSLEFIGEDRIKHTPKDEKVRVRVGNAFDIVGERHQLKQRQLGKKSREETIEIKLRNHKDESVKVTVIENPWGDWEIRDSSHEYKKVNTRTVEFPVKVPKDGETIITYTIFYRW